MRGCMELSLSLDDVVRCAHMASVTTIDYDTLACRQATVGYEYVLPLEADGRKEVHEVLKDHGHVSAVRDVEYGDYLHSDVSTVTTWSTICSTPVL